MGRLIQTTQGSSELSDTTAGSCEVLDSLELASRPPGLDG